MSIYDWLILVFTLLFIVLYGIWKSRGMRTLNSYLLADEKLPWYHVGFSVMATQASAITFLSAPGQAYTDGMRFLQFYFGLPLAMIVICTRFIPIFKNLNVFTAYEYLEKRFDNKTRSLTAFLFLLQRGLSTGVTIYAPALVLSTILQLDINYTTIVTGSLVILYTVYGGTKAVSHTQLLQMTIIFAGLFSAAYMVVHLLPPNVGFLDALQIAGKMNKLNAIDFKLDFNNKYNVWSGLIGGFFLQLSYFGTDQSQVGRYLTGKSVAQSRLGLVFNGLVKIPMQFLILLIGTMVFTFYQFHEPPIFFNSVELNRIENSAYKSEFRVLESEYHMLHQQKQQHLESLVSAVQTNNNQIIDEERIDLNETDKKSKAVKKAVIDLMIKNNPKADVNDTNFIFLSFVMKFLPVGMVGLLIAIIFLASMGSTASGLNSLASTTVVDFYKRFIYTNATPSEYLTISRWITVAWGIFCIGVAFYASKLGNLIEAVNVLGSLFYGTILGIFLTAFFLKKVNGSAVFYAALVAEAFIIVAWLTDLTSFLWLNLIGVAMVMMTSILFQIIFTKQPVE